MATRATQETIVERVSIGNLFLPVPDTDFRNFLEKVEELGRRGLKPVRAELMEKVLAYNCCRIILMKKRRREELEKAA